jgi:hypothetical protein
MDAAQAARIAKFQKLWRSKRVFTNSQGSWKVSSSALTTKIVTFKLPVNFRAVFESAPKGFSEVMGYKTTFKKPVVRWDNGRWIGDAEGVSKVIAKRGQQTIVLTDKYFDVMGLGNYEEALLAIVRNGWAPKILLRAPPTYKKIDGIFYVNTEFDLDGLADELRTHLPATMRESVTKGDSSTGVAVPAVVLKLKQPKWTYQFFKNGTVLFTGIKDPSERDEPRKLFKEFFTSKYDITAMLALNLGKNRAVGKPAKGGNATAKKAALANRYPLARSWNATRQGFYVRPGTNGKPRFYKWRKMEKELQTGEWVNRGAMGLTKKNAVVVAKAFNKAGVPIPAATRNVFNRLGFPLEAPRSASVAAGPKNRRAPSWNSTKPGFYVRPGPGKQPYWFKVPEGLAAGRKTVIKTYTEAGRNIPAAVRNIFKIPANVKTNGNGGAPEHVVKMGLNRVLRINNRQATRLTKPELLAIARNMNIAEANSKMNPATLIGLIQNKAGVSNKLNRSYDVFVNGLFYKFGNDGRVTRTTGQGAQTHRAWATIPVAEQNKIAKALLPANYHAEYNTTAKSNKFNTLRAFAAGKRPAPSPPKPSPKSARTPSPSSAGSNNNMAREFEYATLLAQNLGNLYRNGNEHAFLKVYGKLPVGARGKALKTNVNKAYKKFVKETKGLRANEPARARYTSRIQIPNWMPANKVKRYTNLVTNLAFMKPKPKAANVKTAIRAWINREVPMSPARAARNVENAITGERRHIPAQAAKPRKTPPIPKRTPPPKKSPKAADPLKKEWALPSNRAGLSNLNNALTNLGLPTGPNNRYTWAGLERAGLNKKFKKVWAEKVAKA